MKRLISIILLNCYLLSTTQLSELLKLPILVEHFLEHKTENPEITFFAFLEMHYAHGDVKDADYEKDMKLPFKTLNTNISFVSICCTTNFIYTLSKPNFKAIYKQKFPNSVNHFSSNYLDAIWQPPRST